MSLTLPEALAIATRLGGARAGAFRVIDRALHEPWFDARLREAPGHNDPDDVRQEVMNRLLPRRDAIEGRRPFEGKTEGEARAFLGIIVVRVAIDLVKTRLKYEGAIGEGAVDRLPDPFDIYEVLLERDLQRRVEEILMTAVELVPSAQPAVLERHLYDVSRGQAAAAPAAVSDARARTRLRKERSRSLSLLRRAHEAAVERSQEVGRPDELDRLLCRLLETRKPTTELEEEE